MASIARKELSGKTNSVPIAVSASTTPGTTIHTAVNTAGSLDEVWLYATNPSGALIVLTLVFTKGATVVTKSVGLPAGGEYEICPGISYGNGLVISIYASAAVVIDGYVNRTVE